MTKRDIIRIARERIKDPRIMTFSYFHGLVRSKARKADRNLVKGIARWIYNETAEKELRRFYLEEWTDGVKARFNQFWQATDTGRGNVDSVDRWQQQTGRQRD